MGGLGHPKRFDGAAKYCRDIYPQKTYFIAKTQINTGNSN
jgi:hypothetical protein